MPETVAQKRQRKLQEAITKRRLEARARRIPEQSPEDKIVTDSAASSQSAEPETKSEPTPTPARSAPQQISIPKPKVGQAKTYQKHVLFAVVSAFIIQLVANGVTLPVKKA